MMLVADQPAAAAAFTNLSLARLEEDGRMLGTLSHRLN